MSEALAIYFPLLGLAYNHLGVALLDREAALYKPSPDEWRLLNNSQAWYEQVNHGTDWVFDEHAVPACVHLDRTMNEDNAESVGPWRAFERGQQEGWDAVLILRLFRSGWFLTPHLYQVCYAGPDGLFGRQPGPYRQIRVADYRDLVDSCYELEPADMVTSASAPAPIAQTAALVREYRRTGSNSSADYALQNFHSSYSLFTSWAQRCGRLFTALDTMLGGMGARAIHHTPLSTRFRQRVLTLLENGGMPEAAEHARWLDDHAAGGRYLRNQVAHGNFEPVEDLARASYARLQYAVRVILRQYIAFSAMQATGREAMTHALGLGDRFSLAEGFNVVVERSGAGSDAAAHLLTAMAERAAYRRTPALESRALRTPEKWPRSKKKV